MTHITIYFNKDSSRYTIYNTKLNKSTQLTYSNGNGLVAVLETKATRLNSRAEIVADMKSKRKLFVGKQA